LLGSDELPLLEAQVEPEAREAEQEHTSANSCNMTQHQYPARRVFHKHANRQDFVNYPQKISIFAGSPNKQANAVVHSNNMTPGLHMNTMM